MAVVGTLNRLLRRIGVGRPLYQVEGLRVRFTGDDPHDRLLFREFVEAELPYGFLYDTNNEDGRRAPSSSKEEHRESEFRDWLSTYAVGLNWHVYNPLFGQGEIRFARPEDALALRMTFNDLIDLPGDPLTRPHV